MVLYKCSNCGSKKYKEISLLNNELNAKCLSCGFEGIFSKYWFFSDKKKIVFPITPLEEMQKICSKIESVDLVNNKITGLIFNKEPTLEEITLIKNKIKKELYEW